MAKAIAKCVCAECGAEFERVAFKRNRREADEWIEWAQANLNKCPQCWGKEQRAKEEATPPTLSMSIVPLNIKHPVLLMWSGNTRPTKDTLKELGYRWSEQHDGGLEDFLSIRTPKMAWGKEIAAEDLQAEIDKARAAIPDMVVQNNIREIDMQFYLRYRAEHDAKEAERKAKIAEIPKPEKPACYPSGRWNGKVYGSKRNGYCIYVDGVKVAISPEDAAALERYQIEIEEYRQKVKAIENA